MRNEKILSEVFLQGVCRALNDTSLVFIKIKTGTLQIIILFSDHKSIYIWVMVNTKSVLSGFYKHFFYKASIYICYNIRNKDIPSPSCAWNSFIYYAIGLYQKIETLDSLEIRMVSKWIKILDDSTMVFDRDKKEDRLFCLTRYFSSNGFWWSFLLAIYCHQIFANVLENETSNISKSISLDISHWVIPDKFNIVIFVRKLKS